MLTLKALHVDDFGPFRGHQTVGLSQQHGVTIIYGENMRGKTSLLNAIRFAFFGKVIGRGTKPLPLQKIGNWESAAQGRFGFSVQLEFTENGHSYKLTRSFKPRSGIVTPVDDHDFEADQFLERDGTVLGPQQTESELARILPEQISRFFLFDGELLQEYEDLLSSDADMGRRISEAIERILGVPVLTSARNTLSGLVDAAERREAVAAQGDQKTQLLGNQLAQLQATRQVLAADLTRLESDHRKALTTKSSLEEALKRRERYATLLGTRDSLERQIAEIAARRAAKELELQGAMSMAWVCLLNERIAGAATSSRAAESALQTELMRQDVLKSLHTHDGLECPACLQPLSQEAKQNIESRIHLLSPQERTLKDEALSALRRNVGALDQHLASSNPQLLKVLWDAVEEATMELVTKKGDRDEISKQLEGVDEEDLRNTKVEFEAILRHINALESGLNDVRSRLERNRTDSEGIQRKLDRQTGGSLAGERRRRETFAELHRLFDEAVGAYREQLRARVEDDATRHFKLLTTEPEYERLSINENYGLTILHRDGSQIPVRSAGAEHVVALCLMGALQANAPLRGPIVIDSPFGRLDQGHTRNIVRALPGMAEQVVLLVYEDELPPDLAREELRGKLRGEWKLERRTARHTELVARKD